MKWARPFRSCQVARFAISQKNIHHEQPTSPPLSSTTAAIPLQRATAIQPAVQRRRALQSLRERPKVEEIVSRSHGKFIANKSIIAVNIYLIKRLFLVTIEAARSSTPNTLSNGEFVLVKELRDKRLSNETTLFGHK